MSDIIASSEQVCRTGAGERFKLSITVRAPFCQEDGPWACPVHLHGLGEKERCIYGEDSLQALGLALAFVRAELRSFAESGGRLLDPDSGEEIAVDEYITNLFCSSD
jgi:hypothetical protein